MLRITISMTLLTLLPTLVLAHCDTLDGPVVLDARAALERGDVTPLLKWVRPTDETETRQAFDQAQQVRKLGPQAKELADHYFFETLVRLHRAGEGAPYTGLKPAGTDLDHAVVAADKALTSGSDEDLTTLLTTAARQGLHERFMRVRQTREHKDDSVEAGRAYVAAYVTYIHYVEALHLAILGQQTEHEGAPAPAPGHSD